MYHMYQDDGYTSCLVLNPHNMHYKSINNTIHEISINPTCDYFG
jgi:hypothetical protein